MVGVSEMANVTGEEENNGVKLIEAATDEEPALHKRLRGRTVAARVTAHVIGVPQAGLVTPVGVKVRLTLEVDRRLKLTLTLPGLPSKERPKVN